MQEWCYHDGYRFAISADLFSLRTLPFLGVKIGEIASQCPKTKNAPSETNHSDHRRVQFYGLPFGAEVFEKRLADIRDWPILHESVQESFCATHRTCRTRNTLGGSGYRRQKRCKKIHQKCHTSILDPSCRLCHRLFQCRL